MNCSHPIVKVVVVAVVRGQLRNRHFQELGISSFKINAILCFLYHWRSVERFCVAQTMPSVWTTMDPLVDAVVTLSDNKFNVLERLLSPSPPGIVPNPLSKKWRLKAG